LCTFVAHKRTTGEQQSGGGLAMTTTHLSRRGTTLATIGVIAIVGLWSMASAGSADAATVLNGPINLGTSSTYGALAGSALTNTGATAITGDIGVDPGSSITGMGGAPGSNTGATNDNNAAALQAKNDLTTAYNDAAGLTPTTSGLGELAGLSLVPGVYSGGALSLSDNGTLTLAGTSANSVWVFQAASSLTIGSATHIVITGGASACNVFWQVGSSATIGTSAQFQGTVLASTAITAQTGASVVGRLLAGTAAVTLDTNAITVPTGCAAGGTPISTPSPEITSGAPSAATAGTPYSFDITASGTPTPTFSITSGALPAGLALAAATGMITGTPTSRGVSTFTVTASNSNAPDVSAVYTLATGVPLLAFTGVNPLPAMGLGGALLLVGGILLALRRRTTHQGAHS
jgi:hypothetical protein